MVGIFQPVMSVFRFWQVNQPPTSCHVLWTLGNKGFIAGLQGSHMGFHKPAGQFMGGDDVTWSETQPGYCRRFLKRSWSIQMVIQWEEIKLPRFLGWWCLAEPRRHDQILSRRLGRTFTGLGSCPWASWPQFGRWRNIFLVGRRLGHIQIHSAQSLRNVSGGHRSRAATSPLSSLHYPEDEAYGTDVSNSWYQTPSQKRTNIFAFAHQKFRAFEQ